MPGHGQIPEQCAQRVFIARIVEHQRLQQLDGRQGLAGIGIEFGKGQRCLASREPQRFPARETPIDVQLIYKEVPVVPGESGTQQPAPIGRGFARLPQRLLERIDIERANDLLVEPHMLSGDLDIRRGASSLQ